MATAVAPEYLPTGSRAVWPTCISKAEQDEALALCKRGQTVLYGLGLSEPFVSDPCRAAALPRCLPSPKITKPNVPILVPGTPEDSGFTTGQLVVGGLLAVLVVGGVAYAVTRKKKGAS